MSVDYSANIYMGYELADDWENIVPQEYYEEHEELFVRVNEYDGEPVMFAVNVDGVDCGDFTELSLSLTDDDCKILNHFSSMFPKAITHNMPKYFLGGRVY